MLLYVLLVMVPVLLVGVTLLAILLSIALGGAPGMPIADEDLPEFAPTGPPRAHAA